MSATEIFRCGGWRGVSGSSSPAHSPRPSSSSDGNNGARGVYRGDPLILRAAAQVVDRGKHALRDGWRIEDRRQTIIGKACNRIADREPYRYRQHQWRLADGLGVEDRGFAIRRVIEDPRIEDRRHVATSRDFVGRWAVGAQVTFGIPPQLLGGEPAHALDERALDLPKVDRGVERAAAVLDELG